MKLDEALQHRWAGKEIRRRGWLNGSFICSKWLAGKFSSEDFDADDWEVVTKRVGFREAWDHMKLGNKVIKDGKIYRIDSTIIRDAIVTWKHAGGDLSAGWYRLSGGVPIDWIDATDFELVED